MYNILALVIGALISIMISFNSGLEGYVGSTYSVVIIHAVGLIAILIVATIKKEKISCIWTISVFILSRSFWIIWFN